MNSLVQSALKSISRKTLFLNRLHDFSLLSSNSFSHPFLKSKLMKKFIIQNLNSQAVGLRNLPSRMKFFGFKKFFFMNFDFKNGCENEFEHNNEKSCSRFKNRVPLKSISESIGLTSPTRQLGS